MNFYEIYKASELTKAAEALLSEEELREADAAAKAQLDELTVLFERLIAECQQKP